MPTGPSIMTIRKSNKESEFCRSENVLGYKHKRYEAEKKGGHEAEGVSGVGWERDAGRYVSGASVGAASAGVFRFSTASAGSRSE